MYRLSPDALEGLTLKVEREECNLLAALDILQGAKPKERNVWDVLEFKGDIYIAGANEVNVEGGSHELRILSELLELAYKGVKPRYATWFLFAQNYDSDTFFVHYDGKIVDEHYYFYSELPQIFSKGCIIDNADFESNWFSISCPDGTDEAFARYWYRRFYTETLTGQLMMLNPEEPAIYYHSREIHQLTKDAPVLTETLILVLLRMFWCVVFLLIAVAIPVLFFITSKGRTIGLIPAVTAVIAAYIGLRFANPLAIVWWSISWKGQSRKRWMAFMAYGRDGKEPQEFVQLAEKPVSDTGEQTKAKSFFESSWFYLLILILGILAIIGLERIQ